MARHFNREADNLLGCGRVHMATLPRAEMWACQRFIVSDCGQGETWARVQVVSVEPSTGQHAWCVEVSAKKSAGRGGEDAIRASLAHAQTSGG